jgi:hypothetical protein
MMRIVPAAKAIALANSRSANKYGAFTALRMMSSAAPTIKVGKSNR